MCSPKEFRVVRRPRGDSEWLCFPSLPVEVSLLDSDSLERVGVEGDERAPWDVSLMVPTRSGPREDEDGSDRESGYGVGGRHGPLGHPDLDPCLVLGVFLGWGRTWVPGPRSRSRGGMVRLRLVVPTVTRPFGGHIGRREDVCLPVTSPLPFIGRTGDFRRRGPNRVPVSTGRVVSRTVGSGDKRGGERVCRHVGVCVLVRVSLCTRKVCEFLCS